MVPRFRYPPEDGIFRDAGRRCPVLQQRGTGAAAPRPAGQDKCPPPRRIAGCRCPASPPLPEDRPRRQKRWSRRCSPGQSQGNCR